MKEEMALVIPAAGPMYTVEPANKQKFGLEQLQEIVGGYIEIIPLAEGTMMVLNEEGKLDGLPYNLAATQMARGYIFEDDFIVGDVLVCPSEMID